MPSRPAAVSRRPGPAAEGTRARGLLRRGAGPPQPSARAAPHAAGAGPVPRGFHARPRGGETARRTRGVPGPPAAYLFRLRDRHRDRGARLRQAARRGRSLPGRARPERLPGRRPVHHRGPDVGLDGRAAGRARAVPLSAAPARPLTVRARARGARGIGPPRLDARDLRVAPRQLGSAGVKPQPEAGTERLLEALKRHVLVVFMLGCFAVLLFLWIAFGGAVPLKAKRYEVRVSFPEATTLAEQADVRVAGVTVGKVRGKELDKSGTATRVRLSIDPDFAPLPAGTKAILRQKSLFGETYVELTPGSRGAPKLADGATIQPDRVEPTVELDEILGIFDKDTKRAFRAWIKDSALITRRGGGRDLNAALGNLPSFAGGGADLLGVLDRQGQAVRLLVRNTGQVLGASNERSGQLRALIENADRTFGATAASQDG